MTTSGTTAWPMTARDAIRHALAEAMIMSSGEQPDANELVDCMTRLNGMLKSWGAKASNLWREASGTVTIPAGTATFDLNGEIAGLRDVVSARVIVSATYKRPIFAWVRDDYYGLPNRTTSGIPTAFYLSRGLGANTLHVWPVPTEDTDIELDYLRSPETVTDAGQTLDFPEEYQEALYANLAVRCAGLFGETPAPELVTRAEVLERDLLDGDRPDSYYMVSGCG